MKRAYRRLRDRPKLFGGLGGSQSAESEGFQHMTNEGGSMTMEELLVLFMGVVIPAPRAPHGQSFRRPRSVSASSKTGRGGESPLPLIVRENGKVSCFARTTTG